LHPKHERLHGKHVTLLAERASLRAVDFLENSQIANLEIQVNAKYTWWKVILLAGRPRLAVIAEYKRFYPYVVKFSMSNAKSTMQLRYFKIKKFRQ
jgi:hypothetical protein